MSVPWWIWAATLAVILAMLGVDLLVHRSGRADTTRQAVLWSTAWIALGVGFGAVVWALGGAQRAGEYFGGYLIEKSLAVDNIFVFALIFSGFAVPRACQRRVLFFGVLGALVMRAGFIAGGTALLHRFDWVLYVFGAVLLGAAWRMVRSRGRPSGPGHGRAIALIRRVIPTVDTYRGQRFLVHRAGRLAATPLLVVLILIEVSDLVFAVDSIPAVFAVTGEPFLVFTSNAFAVLGLRALYLLLAGVMDRFGYLKLGLAAVLGFVGVKMLLLDVVHIPIAISLGVIAACLAVAVGASLRAPPDRAAPREAEEHPPARVSAGH